MRDDNLAVILDRTRFQGPWIAARDLFNMGEEPVSGHTVSQKYGLLAHYCNADRLPLIFTSGQIGNPLCWLSPTPYASCMSPYGLGLDTPRNACLLVDVEEVSRLWGPGICPPSRSRPNIWRGGGVEFFSPDPITTDLVRHIIELEPCGDG